MIILKDGTVKCTWDDFDAALDKFVKFYKEKNLRFSGIYAIPRGGLVPGVCLSNRLELPLLCHCPDDDILIVDDIADKGRALTPFVGKKKFIFTIFYHKQSLVVPDFWVYGKNDGWIEFPWERKS